MNKPSLETVTNGIFVPKGIISNFDLVYDKSNNLVELSEYRRGKDLSIDLSKAPKKLPKNLKIEKSKSDRPFIFLGHFEVWHYGHWLIEGIARFWYLLDKDSSSYLYPVSNTIKARSRYLWNRVTKAEMLHWKNGIKTFGILPEQFVHYHHPVQIQKILVPECSMHSLYRITPEHIRVAQDIASYVIEDYKLQHDTRPVYLSRTKLSKGNRTTQGEMPIEDYCRQQGFRIVYPEHMSFLEQVKMFNEHDYFVGFAGSAFHSLILRLTDRPVKCLYMCDHRLRENIDLVDKLMKNNSEYINCCIKIDHDNKTYEFESDKAISAIKNWLPS